MRTNWNQAVSSPGEFCSDNDPSRIWQPFLTILLAVERRGGGQSDWVKMFWFSMEKEHVTEQSTSKSNRPQTTMWAATCRGRTQLFSKEQLFDSIWEFIWIRMEYIFKQRYGVNEMWRVLLQRKIKSDQWHAAGQGGLWYLEKVVLLIFPFISVEVTWLAQDFVEVGSFLANFFQPSTFSSLSELFSHFQRTLGKVMWFFFFFFYPNLRFMYCINIGKNVLKIK